MRQSDKAPDTKNLNRKIKSLEQQLQVEQVDSQEKINTIEKLRELLEQKEQENETLVKELEKMANRLAESQEALFEAQDSETFQVEGIE